MVKTLLAATLLTSLISSALAAIDYTPPKVYECDAPGTDGYYLTEDEVSYDNASDACVRSGGLLADANNHNFLLLSDLVRVCVGENQNAWVRSWDFNPTNPEERRCLAISVGHSGAGGGINPACDVDRYAICKTGGRRAKATPNGNIGVPYRTVTVTQTVTVQYGNNQQEIRYSTNAPQVQYSNYFVTYGPSEGGSTQVITRKPVVVTSSAEPSPTLFNFSFLAEAPVESESSSSEV